MHRQTNRVAGYWFLCFFIGILSHTSSFAQQKEAKPKNKTQPAAKVPPKKDVVPPKESKPAKTTAKSGTSTQPKKETKSSAGANNQKSTANSVKKTPPQKNIQSKKGETKPLKNVQQKKEVEPQTISKPDKKEEEKPHHSESKSIEGMKTKVNNLIHYSIPDTTKQFAHQLFHRKDRDSIYFAEKDIVDLLFVKSNDKREKRANKGLYTTFFVAPGLSPTSSLYLTLISNYAFYLGPRSNTNLSSIDFSPVYSFHNEYILPLKSNLWTKNNKYNIITEWRRSSYPEYTYGLGGGTLSDDKALVTSLYTKFHQTIQQKVYKNWFAGIGYFYDRHSHIQTLTSSPVFPSGYEKYGFVQGNTLSSGIALNIQSNTRSNPINPTGGRYFRTIFRINMGLLGSTLNWQEFYSDYRRYFRVSKKTPNILAFNALMWLAFGENIPYLDLPYLGGDAYGRTGRGYATGRYRGQYMFYTESEYRFRLMKNGLLGSVLFLNLSTFSEPATNKFVYLLPGFGTGLRVKLDKRSKANLAIDLGVGLHGSWDIRFNIGEVF